MTDVVDTLRQDRTALEDALVGLGCTVKGKAATCPWHDDRTPSASILEGDGGAWRLWCHVCNRGGDVWDMRAHASGRPVEDLLREANAGDRQARTPPKDEPRRYATLDGLIRSFASLEASYRYEVRGESEPRLVILRLRHGTKKTFLQAHHDGQGWVLKAPPKPWPLYRLPEIASAPAVVVCEGEKAAEALRAVGIPATTAPCGAGKAAHADWSPLKGKRVCIWPDHDETGQKHADEVAVLLREAGASEVRMIEPGRLAVPIPPKGDAVEFLAALGDLDGPTKRAAVCEVLRAAQTTGGSRLLAKAIEDAIAGRRQLVRWPWPMLTGLTRSLLPGSVTVLVAPPGAAKSMLTLTAILAIRSDGHRVALFELEEDREFWLGRFLSILDRDSKAQDIKWQADNPEAARAAYRRQAAAVDEVDRYLWINQDATYSDIGDWIEARCAAGARVLVVDPVNCASAGKEKIWEADRRLIMRTKRAAAAAGASVVFVSHPKSGKENRTPHQDSIAGGQAIPRLASSIIWLERHDDDKPEPVRTATLGTVPMTINRVLHVLKARNSTGTGARVGMLFDEEKFTWTEQGLLGPAPRAKRARAERRQRSDTPSDDEDHFR